MIKGKSAYPQNGGLGPDDFMTKLNMLGHSISNDPKPSLVVRPRDKDAAEFSERLIPRLPVSAATTNKQARKELKNEEI